MKDEGVSMVRKHDVSFQEWCKSGVSIGLSRSLLLSTLHDQKNASGGIHFAWDLLHAFPSAEFHAFGPRWGETGRALAIWQSEIELHVRRPVGTASSSVVYHRCEGVAAELKVNGFWTECDGVQLPTYVSQMLEAYWLLHKESPGETFPLQAAIWDTPGTLALAMSEGYTDTLNWHVQFHEDISRIFLNGSDLSSAYRTSRCVRRQMAASLKSQALSIKTADDAPKTAHSQTALTSCSTALQMVLVALLLSFLIGCTYLLVRWAQLRLRAQPASAGESSEQQEEGTEGKNDEEHEVQQQIDEPTPQVRPKSQAQCIAEREVGRALEFNQGIVTVEAVLGHGGSAFVYRVMRPETGDQFALKAVHIRTEQTEREVQAEVKCLSMLRSHPHAGVVSCAEIYFMGCATNLASGKRWGFMLLEVGECTLRDRIEDCEARNVDICGRLLLLNSVVGALSGLAHLHALRIIHADVKPSNILLFADGSSKVADFGSALFPKDGKQFAKQGGHGSIRYAAPERFYNGCTLPVDGQWIMATTDVWAIGIIVYELVYGTTPFGHLWNVRALMFRIADRRTKIPYPTLEDDLSGGLRGVLDALLVIMQQCLLYEAIDRPTAAVAHRAYSQVWDHIQHTYENGTNEKAVNAEDVEEQGTPMMTSGPHSS